MKPAAHAAGFLYVGPEPPSLLERRRADIQKGPEGDFILLRADLGNANARMDHRRRAAPEVIQVG
jgi:hypothetical protein